MLDASAVVDPPFVTLDEMRAAHTTLLDQRRAAGGTQLPDELLDGAEAFVLRGEITGEMLEDDAERVAAQSLIDFWANLLYRAGREVDDALLRDFDPARAPLLPDDLSPYLGLDPFRENNLYTFFGRRRLVESLVAKLAERRLVALVGPSGSGKSSVVQAGMIPALRTGAVPGSKEWRFRIPFVPGDRPLLALASAIRPPRMAPEWADQHAALLLHNPAQIAGLLSEQTVQVLVIDQFEEAFTLCSDEAERAAFLTAIAAVVEIETPQHRVILTMRSDFESFVTRSDEMSEWFERGRVTMTPLSAGELREAIERPAEKVGLKFEPGVVDRLLQELLGEPSALPLLQVTLQRLWEERERNRVTLGSLERVGGGRLALARTADAFYERLIPEEQTTARRILLRMVRLGDGLEVTSARIRRSVLFRSGEDPGRVERVLAKLVAARLVRVTPGRTQAEAQVEVAHEALVRNWPTLVGWLDEQRAELQRRRRLTSAAMHWQASGSNTDALWRGAVLDDAQRYDDLSDQESAFLAASRVALLSEQEARAAALQKELELERRLSSARSSAFSAEQERAGQLASSNSRLFRIVQLACVQILVYIPLFIGISTGAFGLWFVSFLALVSIALSIAVLGWQWMRASRGRAA